MAIRKQLLAFPIIALPLTMFVINIYVVQKSISPRLNVYVQSHFESQHLQTSSISKGDNVIGDGLMEVNEPRDTTNNPFTPRTLSSKYRVAQRTAYLSIFGEPNDGKTSLSENDLVSGDKENVKFVTLGDELLKNHGLKIHTKGSRINLYRPSINLAGTADEPGESETLPDRFQFLNDYSTQTPKSDGVITTVSTGNGPSPAIGFETSSHTPIAPKNSNIKSENEKKSETNLSSFMGAIMKDSGANEFFKKMRGGYDELFYTIYPVSVGVPENEEGNEETTNKSTFEEEPAIKNDTLHPSNDIEAAESQTDGVTSYASYTIPGCKCFRRLPAIREHPGFVKLRRVSDQRLLTRNVEKHSTCSDHSTARGPGQKVVSYSYFGNTSDPGLYNRYFSEIPNRAKEIQNLYPGMVMRVYYDVKQDDHRAHQEMCLAFCNYPHLDFCDMSALPPPWLNFGAVQKVGTMWRFLTLLDTLVDVTLIRDLDSYLLPREVAAVNEWLSSDIPYHVMRDHPLHNTHILAGLWGCNTSLDRANTYHYAAAMLSQPYNDLWDYDQRLLRRILWPAIKDKTMSHDSYTCREPVFQGRHPPRPFPTQRDGRNYTGYGKTKLGATALLTLCPKVCRPQSHKDWFLC